MPSYKLDLSRRGGGGLHGPWKFTCHFLSLIRNPNPQAKKVGRKPDPLGRHAESPGWPRGSSLELTDT